MLNEAELLKQLYYSYYEARRNKRNTLNQLRFEANLEENINRLHSELLEGKYKLSNGIIFINEKPVKREIIAADFRDRVIHHLLFNWIYPLFDKQFIFDSYSCRLKKGTLFGIKRTVGFLRSVSDDYRKQAWILRLDILGYFMAIHRPTLFKLVNKGLQKANYWKNENDCFFEHPLISDLQQNLTLQLLNTTIFHDPVRNSELRGSPDDWNDLPQSKSLIAAPNNCGLPIGNLTSQLFGNVYLNPLDHFVKRELKIKHYGRYVDDMVLLHQDKSVLTSAIPKIAGFLKEQLQLELHPRKIHLQPIQHGFPFLGAFIKPYRTYIGKRTKTNAWKCVEEKNEKAWPSYLGCMSHFSCRKLENRMLEKWNDVNAPMDGGIPNPW